MPASEWYGGWETLEGEAFVLAGFRFEFLDDDHYVSEIANRPNPLSGSVDWIELED